MRSWWRRVNVQAKPRPSSGRPSARRGGWAHDPRVTLGLLGGLGAGEAIVAFAFSMPLGLGLGAGTGALTLLGKVREHAAGKGKPLVNLEGDRGDSVYVDGETGLPNRNQLIDQLAREIARAERYQHPLTLAVVEIERLDDIEAGWGADAVARAVAHAAKTLRRVTRTSDFLSRVDDARFAVALMQCTNEQAKRFAERVELAVGNRPIRAGSRMRGVPVYLSVRVTTLQYDRTRLRGPLDFLSRAGGEMVIQEERTPLPKGAARHPAPADIPGLRRDPVPTYAEDADTPDFAEAYKAFRGRRAG
jgi:diguanylate cyclase (GGDEF)-like protein